MDFDAISTGNGGSARTIPVVLRNQKLTIEQLGVRYSSVMTQRENRLPDPAFSDWCESSATLDGLDVVRLSAARARAIEDAGNSIARQLNGPLTALLFTWKS